MKLFDPLVGKAEREAMLVRAPLDLRANRLRSSRDELALIFPMANRSPA
jgi:16S rRNA (cytosine967-C5)-methyltransferase